MLAKLTLSYQHVYNSCDEDALCKCGTAISSILKVEADMGTDFNLGKCRGYCLLLSHNPILGVVYPNLAVINFSFFKLCRSAVFQFSSKL